MRRAAGDVVYFSSLCKTPYGPLPDYPFFVSLLRDFESGEDVIVAKSRQMMATWAACLVLLHRLLFRRGYSGGLTSRKQALVDDGGENSTVNSLLGRVRYLYNSLPKEFRSAAPIKFSHLRATCASMNSYLVGEGATTEIFRGSTLQNALGDEWAFVPQSTMAYSSVRQACRRGLWLLSTPFGSAGNYAEMWRAQPESYRAVRLHWTSHPLRYDGELDASTGKPTSAWYRAECDKLVLKDAIARELDIDFSLSASGLVFPEFSYDRHMRSDLAYDDSLPIHFGMDFGIGAATAAIVFQVHPSDPIKVRVLADYEMENAPAQVNADNLWSVIKRTGFRGKPDDVMGHGDPAGNAREIATGSTVIKEYRSFGFHQFSTKKVKKSDGIRLVRNMLHQGAIAFSTECNELALRIADYRYPTDDSGFVKGDEPVKNKATHICDALRYGLTGVLPVDGTFLPVHTPSIDTVAPKPQRDVPQPYERTPDVVMSFPERF
jgi:hypothetical protein